MRPAAAAALATAAPLPDKAADDGVPCEGSDFSALSRRITDSGLMKRRPGYYVARIGGVAALYIGAWTAFAMLGHTWWQLAIGGVLGVLFSQIALVAHDIAHRQVFRLRRPARPPAASRATSASA